MKKAILELIDRKIEFYKTGFNPVIHFNEISLLQELYSEVEMMEEWISVSERKPKKDSIIICKTDQNTVIGFYDGETFYTLPLRYCTELKVIKWKYL